MATRKFLVDIDLNQNELQYPKIHNLSGDPAGPTSGQIYFNTTDGNLYLWDGSTWTDIADQSVTDIQAGDPITVTQSGTIFTIGVNATSSNTTGYVVQRDGNGDFSASTITADTVTGLTAPSIGTDATNKNYVDALVQGLDPKDSCRVIATSSITLSGTQSIDGVTLEVGERVLVAGQGGDTSTPDSANGIYDVSSGTWSRSEDADGSPSNEVSAGMFTFITEGTTYADTGWVLSTNDPITVDTTPLQFVQFSQAGVIIAGNGLSQTGNTFNVGAGNGVTVNSDDIEVTAGTGISVDTSGVNVDGSSLAGSGVIWNNTTGEFEVTPGGVTDITAGAGLTGGGTGSVTLDIVAGTGISVLADEVYVDGNSLAGSGVTWNDTLGQFETTSGDITGVTAGDGLTGGGSTGYVTLDVNPGNGISTSGDQVSVVAGTGITVDSSGVNVDGSSLSGNGLVWDATNAEIDVNYGNGLTAAGATLSAFTDGTTIQTNLGGQLEVVPGAFPTKYTQSGVVLGGAVGPVTVSHNLNSLFVNVTVVDFTTGEELTVEVAHDTANSVQLDANGATFSVNVNIIG